MSDHPLVEALAALLEAHKLDKALLLVPVGDELRLIGCGIGPVDVIAMSRSLSIHINQMLEVPTHGKPN